MRRRRREERPDPVFLRDEVLPYHPDGMEVHCAWCREWACPCAVCWWNDWQFDVRWRIYAAHRDALRQAEEWQAEKDCGPLFSV